MKTALGRIATVAALVLIALPVVAQDSEIPRLADGKPNLNGIWQAMNSAHWDVERHLARPALQLREGPHGPLPAPNVLYMGAVGSVPGGMGVVEGGKIPYTEEALKLRDENRANWADRDPEVKCYLPGVPRANYMPYPFQIFQNSGAFFIAYEYAGAVRDIYLEDPGPAPVDSWMGQSYGQWDGDTLVVEVTGQLPSTWLDRSGNHHTDQLKVTERWTLVGPNHINYEATLEDPGVYTEPWKMSMPLYRRMEDNARLMDFRCVEFVEELMYGEYRRHPLSRMIELEPGETKTYVPDQSAPE